MEERPIGKYGRMHCEYLKENNPMLYNDLILSCQFWTYLTDINEQMHRVQLSIRLMKEAESATEKLKEKNQMAWIRAVNSIYHRAEEIVLNEIIYR